MPKTQEAMLEDLLVKFAEKAREKLKSAMLSGAIQEEWVEPTGDDYRLTRAVIDSSCRDRPYRLMDVHDQVVADNVHLCT